MQIKTEEIKTNFNNISICILCQN